MKKNIATMLVLLLAGLLSMGMTAIAINKLIFVNNRKYVDGKMFKARINLDKKIHELELSVLKKS